MVSELRERGIGFTSLHESLDTPTPGGRLVFRVFAVLAEFIRELIVIGTNEGLAAARARGRVGGRPTVATEEVIKAARDLLPDPGRSITSIAKLLGVCPGTLYSRIPDLREPGAEAIGHQLEAPAKEANPSKINLAGISGTPTTHTRRWRRLEAPGFCSVGPGPSIPAWSLARLCRAVDCRPAGTRLHRGAARLTPRRGEFRS
ncbi:recombinase family protein [Streptomyces sp. NPDC021080]|uniref:recombinase family protein n=1 Tax=Streptomyces sp. NPDC021080 TaxID=3365110 RepID=UPI0037AF53BE